MHAHQHEAVLMVFQAGGIRRTLLLTARMVAILFLAVSPRAITAPPLSFNRAQESKRPKPLKNIDRVSSVRVPNMEKQGKDPRIPGTDVDCQDLVAFSCVRIAAPCLPDRAFTALTKPGYLKLPRGFPSQGPYPPPA
jgi:hypothetical protein